MSALLSRAERTALDDDGVLILPNHIAPDVLGDLRLRFDAVVEQEERDGVAQREVGVRSILNAVDKGDEFRVTLTDPTLLAAAQHVIGRPFKLTALNGRSSLPGFGLQGLHPDWEKAVAPGEYSIVNSMWMLDDFTEDNGATRVVPGSHRSGRVPRDDLSDPLDRHPEEIKLLAPAGSVAIFNAHVWHGGTRNDTDQPRRVLHCAFIAREFPQQTDQRASLSPATIERLTDAERYLLDV